MIRIGNGIPLAHDVLQQRPLAALPQRNTFAHSPVQLAEVVLHFAEVGEQLARPLHELLKAILQRRVIQQRHIARQHASDLGIDLIAFSVQFGNALGRIGLTTLAHLLEQVEQREQARFGTDELPFGKLCQPGDGLLGRGRQIELRLVGAGLVKLAQPALIRRCPVVQVFERGLGKRRFAQLQTQGVQLIFQHLGQIRRRHHPHIGGHEHPVQKARHQRCMI